MSGFTNQDRMDLQKIQRKAAKIEGSGFAPDDDRKAQIISLAGEILERHDGVPVPKWSLDERVRARCNWLRCGRTPSEIARSKYSLGMAFAVLPRSQQEELLAANRAEGNTHYAFSIQDEPNRWWDLGRKFLLTPEKAAETAMLLVQEGFIPVPQLFTQNQLHDMTLSQLEAWSAPYAKAMSDWTGFVWATFEHNEPIYPKSYKESLRGDDWITALAGRLERQWGVPIGLHQTGGEFHYYTKWAEQGKDGESPPKTPILLFQCNSWEPDPLAQAHDGDWRYVLQRCNAETGGRQICVPWEYCQLDPSWADDDVREVGAHMSRISPVYSQPRAYGNGGE